MKGFSLCQELPFLFYFYLLFTESKHFNFPVCLLCSHRWQLSWALSLLNNRVAWFLISEHIHSSQQPTSAQCSKKLSIVRDLGVSAAKLGQWAAIHCTTHCNDITSLLRVSGGAAVGVLTRFSVCVSKLFRMTPPPPRKYLFIQKRGYT